MLNKILKLCNDNHWFLIGAIIVAAAVFWSYGCQSRVASMIEPDKKVTRAELQTEVDYLLSQIKNKFDELERQDQIKLLIFEQASLFAETGTINPMGLLTTAVSVVAIGSALDQRRKKIEAEKKAA